MKKKRQIKKRHRRSRKIYGESAHYWPVEIQPFLVAAACVEVVLKNSEKASLIYDKAKKLGEGQTARRLLMRLKYHFQPC